MSFFSILDEAYVRLGIIQEANGYNTDLGLNIKQGGDPEVRLTADLPILRAYIQRRDLDEEASAGKRATVEASMVVEALSRYHNDPNEVIMHMMDDIQTSLEIEPQDFDGKIQSPGLSWLSDDIFFPAESSNIVGVAITYAVPHIRYYGNFDKP